jgi:hypothetical protein
MDAEDNLGVKCKELHKEWIEQHTNFLKTWFIVKDSVYLSICVLLLPLGT